MGTDTSEETTSMKYDPIPMDGLVCEHGHTYEDCALPATVYGTGGQPRCDLHAESANTTTPERLEYLRGQIRAESISMGEVVELQGLADFIDSGDVELLEWAGVPESPSETILIMVLNDGTTFTSLEGCRIVAVPEFTDADEIEEGLSAGIYPTVREFTDGATQ